MSVITLSIPHESLLYICNTLQNCGVQKDHLKTLIGRMRAAHHDLAASVSQRRKNPAYHNKISHQPSNEFLTAVVELIGAAKSLLGWLDG